MGVQQRVSTLGGAVSMVTLAAALGCGVMAGVFFTFSSFVMPALARLPPALGIAAMQSINVAAINRWFMGALFGTAGACVLLAVRSLTAWSLPGARLRFLGSASYVVGVIVVTIAFNVPRNDGLAAVAADSVEGASVWSRYLVEWVAWNHVRGWASFVGAALLTLALLQQRLASARIACTLPGALVLSGCDANELQHPPPLPPGFRASPAPESRLSELGACPDAHGAGPASAGGGCR